jgi:hypothetical protein
MNRIALLSFAALASGVAAQSNTVVGLNGRLEVLDNITYWGRRGAAYPGGEVGLSMRNTMCNPGTVSIPWFAQMQEDHPKFGFLITRLVGDRMVQISDRSYCKHAFTSASTNGACGTCNGIGGTMMGVGCSDTYSAGNNASRNNLGPADEINPWLGTWNHVGSYFDQGDPNVGPPGNTDGAQSPINVGTDEVKNRVTVQESDLQVAGALYFYGIHLVHQGEAVANRGDNIKSRGFTASYSGTTWSVANSGVGETFGSILQHWPGATLNSGGNGNDDGRFFVASKVTALGGGNYHYEYAVHNVDNSRGGASLRIPIAASATASNFTFRDIDSNPLNDWTGSRAGDQVVFAAAANNPRKWKTLYNFGFDANIAPVDDFVGIDEAVPGPGQLLVAVAAKAAGTGSFAQGTTVGVGCGSTPGCSASFYELAFDLANSGFTMTPGPNGYTVNSLAGSWIAPAGTTLALGDDSGTTQALPFSLPFPGGSTSSLWICSNGFCSVPGANSTSYTPSSAAFLTGARTWAALWHDLNPGAGGTVRFDATAQRAVITFNAVNNYGLATTVTFQWQFWANGTVHVVYQAVASGGNGYLVGYTPGGTSVDPGARDISASLPAGFSTCYPEQPSTPGVVLNLTGRPVLGTTVTFDTSNIPSGSLLGISILSLTQYSPGIDLTSIGMPGCTLYLALDVMNTFSTPGSTASVPWSVPNVPTAAGLVVMNQSAVLKAGINPFGFVTSNALQLLLGVN